MLYGGSAHPISVRELTKNNMCVPARARACVCVWEGVADPMRQLFPNAAPSGAYQSFQPHSEKKMGLPVLFNALNNIKIHIQSIAHVSQQVALHFARGTPEFCGFAKPAALVAVMNVASGFLLLLFPFFLLFLLLFF